MHFDAFDTVSHIFLNDKLKHNGFEDEAIFSVESYLCNRYQNVFMVTVNPIYYPSLISSQGSIYALFFLISILTIDPLISLALASIHSYFLMILTSGSNLLEDMDSIT